MSKYTIVFCEGAHDVAFILRILKNNNYSEITDEIKNLKEFNIELINYFIEGQSRRVKSFAFNPNNKIPKYVLRKKDGNEFIFLHDLGGDKNEDVRKIIKERYLNLISPKEDDDYSKDIIKDISYRFLYFFDADEKGCEVRKSEIEEELNISGLENGKIKKIDNKIEYGIYIFCNSETKKGTLEDILLKILQENENPLYKNITDFLEKNSICPERRKNYDDQKKKHSGQEKYNEKKTIVGIFGQLQLSGVNNQVIIEKTDYFKNEQLQSLKEYNEILNLFY